MRVTPAMEAGLSDHVWVVEELVNLLEPKSIRDGLNMVAYARLSLQRPHFPLRKVL